MSLPLYGEEVVDPDLERLHRVQMREHRVYPSPQGVSGAVVKPDSTAETKSEARKWEKLDEAASLGMQRQAYVAQDTSLQTMPQFPDFNVLRPQFTFPFQESRLNIPTYNTRFKHPFLG